MWIGRNVMKSHYGVMDKWDGEIEIKNGKISAGKLVLDMNSIKDLDLEDKTYRKILESHLKSEDFFDVENYPEAFFVLTNSKKIDGAKAGAYNYLISGNLIIKNIKRKMQLKIILGVTPDAKFSIHGHLDVDRTLFKVMYGSGKFFEKLGMHVVDDVFTLEFYIIGK